MTLTITPSHPFLVTDGRDFDLFPMASELTVSQAAELLNMSEGCVCELLQAGIVTSRQENGEHLLQRDSLLEFETRYRKRLEGLAEITQLSQEMGLYD